MSQKTERCVEEFIVGSHLPYLICEGDPPPHNVANISQQELRDRISRSARPARQN